MSYFKPGPERIFAIGLETAKRSAHTMVLQKMTNTKAVANRDDFILRGMYLILCRISRVELLPFQSSRPKELPLQPLTEPDVNLSIYPALIDQPQAVYTANEGKGLVHAELFG